MGLLDKWRSTTKKYADDVFVAIADGEMISPDNIADLTFAKELMGQTIGFRIKSGKIVSPTNGKVEVLYPSKHAFAIRMKDGTGVLVHIGIDTVSLNGKGFKAFVKQGDEVCAGDTIVEVDLDLLDEAGLDSTTMLVITETKHPMKKIDFINFGEVNKGQVITR